MSDFFNARVVASKIPYLDKPHHGKILGLLDAGDYVEVVEMAPDTDQWLYLADFGWVCRGYIKFINDDHKQQFTKGAK